MPAIFQKDAVFCVFYSQLVIDKTSDFPLVKGAFRVGKPKAIIRFCFVKRRHKEDKRVKGGIYKGRTERTREYRENREKSQYN